MRFRPTFVALALAANVPHALTEDLQPCGEARYFPSEYTCYNNATLCPTVFGLPNFPCNGACYYKEMYQCTSEKLRLLPEATGMFGLVAHSNSPYLDGQQVKACGNYLAVGAGARECTTCRGAGPDVACASYQNKTVLLTTGEMATDISGGQYWYVNTTDGTLMYSEGGTANGPEVSLAGQSVTVYRNGFFTSDLTPHYWLACLRTLPGGTPGTSRAYRIYTSITENLKRTDCEQIKLVVTAVSDRKQGTYKYE